MATVDPLYAQWLMAEALWQVFSDTTLATRWGASAHLTSRGTTIATKADAIAEATRQIAFMGGPLAIEEHQLVGAWRSYLARVITLTIARIRG